MKMAVQEEEIRKGPWTEQEDMVLVNFVQMLGDRRWDFIAKVSGLNRTGKSCRLRWVNYLHPGLKRGKMTPQEERLVVELHAKWGNRWSRIARKLPGRTDNEIKNYWRTHTRKKAQERKRAAVSSQSSSSSSNCSSSASTETTKASFYDTGGDDETAMAAAAAALSGGGGGKKKKMMSSEEEAEGFNNAGCCCYSMDDIWKDIELSEEENIIKQGGVNGIFACPSIMASPASWEYCLDSILKMDDEDQSKMMMTNLPNNYDHFISSWAATLTG